ncbi:hypothetical protein GCM10011504_44540 [Siccirubricoccus deserti]|nr:hypothetical protein GCM10011504_44540 [Siccirubricoccus deserti]
MENIFRIKALRVPINTGHVLVSFRGFAAEGVPKRRSGGDHRGPRKTAKRFCGEFQIGGSAPTLHRGGKRLPASHDPGVGLCMVGPIAVSPPTLGSSNQR